jgi:hypothetical protein
MGYKKIRMSISDRHCGILYRQSGSITGTLIIGQPVTRRGVPSLTVQCVPQS